ncbi:hypothetical protein [Streptomyces flavofungini]|uniref:Uncharacterized protein n=1 Tax=Streptomyces flavofungini TaxID=68200 RepID=A0ABS0XFB6_9ACTN|nr:hypothetical protein [Streptomyces flavofungini]MBJ3811915.1 hypothetical protein [Streptomyces flavofungini]GHC52473.1 hypothetical protein GCM10010349_18120 [Streptomyces flavofungini]
MSGVSRRSLLGYSGSAAAGAVLASAGTAQADDKGGAAAAQTAEGSQSAVAFEPGTQFSGRVQHGSGYAELSMTFSVRVEEPSGQQEVTPADIAEALNDLAAKRGWPPITFYGTPPKVRLN